MAKSIRVSDGMYELASQAGEAMHRSLAEQVEFWARLGAALDAAGITMEEAAALLKGDAQVKDRILEQLNAKRHAREFKGFASIEKRKKQFEREVVEGKRSARSLFFIDSKRAREATVLACEPEVAGDGW
ncbi:hypothetical protein [Pelomonas sp. KK5]|uniref:TA system antitoxin ParD family protein n=1 Tax=Pelomonas sp. KK5 TaxID=1855730 RepID=UPI00097BB367|nr:hypothetical protein [Pelomonas sp. KK5]